MASKSPVSAGKSYPGSGIVRAIGTLREEITRITAAAKGLRGEVEAGKVEGAARGAAIPSR